MNVGSLLEIYTTMFGWSLYNMFYDLFNLTGLLYLPFLMALFRNWRDPFLSQDDKPAAVTSQRRMQYSVISMLVVYSIAVLPLVPLNVDEVTYEVACTNPAGGQDTTNNGNGGNTGTQYDNNLASVNNVRIPFLWYVVLNISSGLNYASTASFECFEDIKGLDEQLRHLTISDPDLKQEYNRFANECFLKAKSKFHDSLKGGKHQSYVQSTFDGFLTQSIPGSPFNVLYDARDPYYIGSHYYLQTTGFYEWDGANKTNCHSEAGGCGFQSVEPVSGWPYVADRDDYSDSYIAAKVNAGEPVEGRPFCDEWWESTQVSLNGDPLGLREKLINSLDVSDLTYEGWDSNISAWENISDAIASGYDTLVYGDEYLQDLVIQRLVGTNPPAFTGQGSADYYDPYSITTGQFAEGATLTGVGSFGVGALAGKVGIPAMAAGAGWAAVDLASKLKDFYLTVYLGKLAAPMVQSVLLMMIYGLLMIYLVMSEYDVEAVFTVMFLIIGLRFFTAIWIFADYLDAQLFVSMYPDATLLGGVFTYGADRLILDIVLTALYLIAPLILLGLMGMAGARFGGIISSMTSLGGSTNKMGNIGVNKKF